MIYLHLFYSRDNVMRRSWGWPYEANYGVSRQGEEIYSSKVGSVNNSQCTAARTRFSQKGAAISSHRGGRYANL